MINVFCNSHCFSQLAAFFIGARAERSTTENCLSLSGSLVFIIHVMEYSLLVVTRGVIPRPSRQRAGPEALLAYNRTDALRTQILPKCGQTLKLAWFFTPPGPPNYHDASTPWARAWLPRWITISHFRGALIAPASHFLCGRYRGPASRPGCFKYLSHTFLVFISVCVYIYIFRQYPFPPISCVLHIRFYFIHFIMYFLLLYIFYIYFVWTTPEMRPPSGPRCSGKLNWDGTTRLPLKPAHCQ